MKKVICYLNQFFGQIGGEDQAGVLPMVKEGAVGPAMPISAGLKAADAEVIKTIVCGDNYFADNQDEATKTILDMVREDVPDLFIAGPGFNAGRYGLACGAICDAVKKEFGIPVVTALYPENPGAEMYCKSVYVIEAPISAAGMRKTLPKVINLAKKILNDEPIGFPEEEGYIPQGFRVNVHTEQNGAERGVDMLIKKLKGEPFVTELPMPTFDRVKPAPAVKDLSTAKIALVTSGGIVPLGNPDRIESANASKFGIYDIENLDDLTGETHMTVHGGYDPVYATEDPDRVLPVDVLRQFEKEGVIGKLYDKFYSTTGNTTAVSSAVKYASEIAEDMRKNGIQAAILTSN